MHKIKVRLLHPGGTLFFSNKTEMERRSEVENAERKKEKEKRKPDRFFEVYFAR